MHWPRLGFVIFLLCVVGALGLARFGGRRRGRGRLRVVPGPTREAKPRRWALRVRRGKLDRKDLYYDPKPFRRSR